MKGRVQMETVKTLKLTPSYVAAETGYFTPSISKNAGRFHTGRCLPAKSSL